MVTRRVSEGEAATESALAHASGFPLRFPLAAASGSLHTGVSSSDLVFELLL